MSDTPVLVAVGHGSRGARHEETIGRLVDAVRRTRPGLRVETGWLDLVRPALGEVLAGLDSPAVLVPLLLGTGYHVRVDIPAVIAAAPGVPARVARALGPHPLLADALCDRLTEAGRAPGDAVVLAAAGSTDPGAEAATVRMARLLARRLDAPVVPSYLCAGSPTPPRRWPGCGGAATPGSRWPAICWRPASSATGPPRRAAVSPRRRSAPTRRSPGWCCAATTTRRPRSRPPCRPPGGAYRVEGALDRAGRRRSPPAQARAPDQSPWSYTLTARAPVQSPWSYTVTAIPRPVSRSMTSGSTRDHVPPARPQPMRGMCTQAPRSRAWAARPVRAVSIAS